MAVVCDGMGGHAMGVVASGTVAKAIAGFWREHANESDNKEKVEGACRKARVALDERSCLMGRVEMGTTMVMASIEGDKVTVAHVGDSRCYLLRSGEGLICQTRDHVRIDFGWEVVARSFFSDCPEMAVPDVGQYELQAGDRLLLCSDGLYRSMAPDDLLARMTDDRPLAEIAGTYDLLCGKQGDDNYTAVLIEITE